MPTVAPRNVLSIKGTQFTAIPYGIYWSLVMNRETVCSYWPDTDTIIFSEDAQLTPSTMLDLARFINNNLRHQNCRTPC